VSDDGYYLFRFDNNYNDEYLTDNAIYMYSITLVYNKAEMEYLHIIDKTFLQL